MISDLVKLGLSEKEARVYLSILEIDGGPVSVIAKRASIQRVGAYHVLEKLREKKLLNRINKNGTTFYIPESPDQILLQAKEKVNIAQSVLPDLFARANAQSFSPKIRFYEGEEGVKKAFLESLEAEKEILNYSNLKKITNAFPAFFKQYTEEKLKNGIKTKYLSPSTADLIAIKKFLPERYDKNLLEVLLINKKQFLFENEIIVYNDTVSVISLDKNENLALIVKSKTFCRTMKSIFNLAWLGATSFFAK